MTHILIVSARFYPEISNELVKGAINVLDNEGATYDEVGVPGAFEIPAAIRFALNDRKYDGFIALGCVIRGETTHYDYVCAESARGLTELSLTHQAAIGYGILTTETMEQAQKRAYTHLGNKGGSAAEACLRMVELKSQFGVT